jgi:enoyl-CoA hydratase
MAVNGIAFTLPIELALAADIVIAADDVRFRQLEIGRGGARPAGPSRSP